MLTLDPPAAAGGPITLHWDERNIGDYNNNGLVEIADIVDVLEIGHTSLLHPLARVTERRRAASGARYLEKRYETPNVASRHVTSHFNRASARRRS